MFLWIPLLAISQNNIEGMVMEDNPGNKQLGLAGANVYWLNSQTGTITNTDGSFVIPFKKEYNQLVIS